MEANIYLRERIKLSYCFFFGADIKYSNAIKIKLFNENN